MRKLLCLFALAFALAPSPSARQRDAPPPAETCDGMKAQIREAAARDEYKDSERTRRFYEAARKFITVCHDPDDKFTLYVAKWVEKYEAAVREFEAGQKLARLLAALRTPDSPESKDPDAYAAVVAAYEVRYEGMLAERKNVSRPRDASEALAAQLDLTADRLIDLYARAVAACGTRAACQSPRAVWLKRLTELYRLRRGGSDAGLEEMIRGALERPPPSP